MSLRAARKLGFGQVEAGSALVEIGDDHLGDRHAEALVTFTGAAEHKIEHAGQKQRHPEHKDQGEGAAEGAGHVLKSDV